MDPRPGPGVGMPRRGNPGTRKRQTSSLILYETGEVVSSTQGTDQLAILNALSDDDYQGRIESAGVTVSE